jgi:hypothetical protein
VRAPVAGAAVAAVATLSFGFIANRYIVDFIPGLIVASLAGLHLLLRWSATKSRTHSRLVWISLGLFAMIGTWSSLGLTILYARSVESHTPQATRNRFEAFQHSVGDLGRSSTAALAVLAVIGSLALPRAIATATNCENALTH